MKKTYTIIWRDPDTSEVYLTDVDELPHPPTVDGDIIGIFSGYGVEWHHD